MKNLLQKAAITRVVGAVVALAALSAAPAFASTTVVQGDPSCADVGYGAGYHGFKIANPTDGAYIAASEGVVIKISNLTNKFDWQSNYGIAAVIVKGGPNAKVYEYNPLSLSDTDLNAPSSPHSDQYNGFSFVTFCFPATGSQN